MKSISVEDLCVKLNSLANTFDSNHLTNDQKKFIEYVYDITGGIPLSNKDNIFIFILNAIAYTNFDHNDIGFSKEELYVINKKCFCNICLIFFFNIKWLFL